MDMKKLKNEEKINYFDRLPEDLLLSILSRTNDDLKFLCQCSLVSKRFASTIYRFQTVSLSLPSSGMPLVSLPFDVFQFFIKCPSFNSREITRFVHSLPNKMLKFALFLQNFKELKSIYLEFMCPKRRFLKWKANCRKSKPMIESCVCVLPALTYKKTDHGFEAEQEDQEIPSNFMSLGSHASMLSLMTCTEWLSIVYLLIKCHHSLESVTITNSEKEGKLQVRNEQIVEWRKICLSEELYDDFKLNAVRFAYVPELHLPLSGYMMKQVTCSILESSGMIVDKEEPLRWEYDDGEEKVLGEVVREILTKHTDKICSKSVFI